MPIADEYVDQWFKQGYTIVPKLFDEDTLAEAVAEAHRYFPTWEEYRDNRPRYDSATGQFVFREFPFERTALNLLSVHPDLIDFAERVMGIERLFMTQSVLWSKYPGPDYDQSLHADYMNNTLLWPRSDGPYQQIPMIIYLKDVTPENGPTRVLSKEWDDLSSGPGLRTKEERPELYENEVAVAVPAGSVLIHTMRTLHRGSAMTATEGMRLSLHVVYRGAGHEWMGWRAFPREGPTAGMKSFMEAATPKQRSMIGIPMPGDPYWNDETIMRVGERYPGMDMTPYAEAATA
jgi:ectoine hydroxylase-related dioxygenase (phytanoyl-CoA dioxygenase family)